MGHGGASRMLKPSSRRRPRSPPAERGALGPAGARVTQGPTLGLPLSSRFWCARWRDQKIIHVGKLRSVPRSQEAQGMLANAISSVCVLIRLCAEGWRQPRLKELMRLVEERDIRISNALWSLLD